jgi:hypothetical protein
MQDPDIATAINDLMAQTGICKRYRIQRLKNLIDHRDGSISAKGLDMSFRLDGSYAPEKQVNVTVDYAAIWEAMQELKTMREKIKALREALNARREAGSFQDE